MLRHNISLFIQIDRGDRSSFLTMMVEEQFLLEKSDTDFGHFKFTLKYVIQIDVFICPICPR